MMTNTKITVYGCEQDEAAIFREISPHFGVMPTLTGAAVSPANVDLALGNHCISVSHKTKIAKPALSALKEVGVKYISTRSIGYNHIDIETARKLGIAVGNVAYSPDSVADYTLMLMLMAIRNAKSIVSRAELSDFRLDAVRGKEMRDLTVGVMGTGRIGSAVIKRLSGFGCSVLAYDLVANTGANYVSLETLLQQSDVITLHMPLDPHTYHFLDHERLGWMKPGAYLINTGRGALVDTAALVTALTTGKLGGAALDVLEGEEGVFYFDRTQNPCDHQLLQQLQTLPNVLITPHTAYYTGHALRDTVEKTVRNCLDFERSKERE